MKPTSEHASFGIDDTSIVSCDNIEQLRAKIHQREQVTGRPHFAERFIRGREFNLSLLADEAGEPAVLPPAEIDFSAFPADKPCIVGHAAKWQEDSFEYKQTPRRFEFSDTDLPLLQRLKSLARECWHLFGLSGYARVDFRVDSAGQPWILEVNLNPCLAPDAGFAAALQQAGNAPVAAFERILRAAITNSRG